MEGLTWPALGVAGTSIAGLITLLVWLIRRQASGAWMTTEEHDKQMARSDKDRDHAVTVASEERDRAIAAAIIDRDRAIASAQKVAEEWQAAHKALALTHAEQTTAFRQATDANRAFDILLRNAALAPHAGDNGPREVTA